MFHDKTWIVMPKWTIFEILFLWKHQCFCFHYWDYLTNIWRNNWQSIFDPTNKLKELIDLKVHCVFVLEFLRERQLINYRGVSFIWNSAHLHIFWDIVVYFSSFLCFFFKLFIPFKYTFLILEYLEKIIGI